MPAGNRIINITNALYDVEKLQLFVLWKSP